MIRLTVPSIDEADLSAVRAVLLTGQLVQGPRVAEFERLVADLVGTAHAIAVTNGTAALQMALLALDTRPGDIVVTSAYSWPATANVVELCGAQPVFVDVRSDSFNMDVDALERVLDRLMRAGETARRVRAILPVHAFGQMADMAAIAELANRYGLPIIEDAACALGASFQKRQAGSWGVMGCFSFHPRKAITTGEGGMITTNNPEIARRLRALRNHGQDPEASTPDFVMPGFNNRMTEFQGALGVSQMQKLNRVVEARRKIAARYDALLEGSPLTPPAVASAAFSVYQSYVTSLPVQACATRRELIADLKADGIETAIGTWHMPMITYYRSRYGYRVGDFPGTDAAFERTLTLPLYEGLTETDQEAVVAKVLDRVSETSAVPQTATAR